MPDNPRLRRGDATRPKVGIVHLGPGAFFRAFNAVYTAQAMDTAGGDWGICAVSLRSPTARDQLAPQDCVYTSVTLAPDGLKHEVIGSIADVLVAPDDPGAVLAAMADPAVKIVSLTITEKGYCHEPSTGRLRLHDPDVSHDLADLSTPRTAVGFIVGALAQRRVAGHRPFTVLTCDNLPANGHLVRGVVLEFARATDPQLASWIEENGRFPSTMVDRITPATTDADLDRVAKETGVRDEAAVLHEPFRQWVIDDDFVDGLRPAWDLAGAQFVRDVTAHELMKLRCLNGTHSAIAYLGYLAGHETIADAVADPAFAALCRRLWAQEIVPTLEEPEGEDLPAYQAALLERYRNPAVRHRTWQIAMDGSQKLPQRILGTVADARAAGREVPGLALTVAAWMRYVGGVDESGAPIDVRDPMAERLRAASDASRDDEERVQSLLAIREVFPAELANDKTFCAAVAEAYKGLVSSGAHAMVNDYGST